MFSRFDKIPACGRQTDGQTSSHSIVRAMHDFLKVKKKVFIDIRTVVALYL